MLTHISHRRPARVPRFYYGAVYYPEHGEFETLELDAERMRAAGMNVVRMAEFAWDLMEPEEGRFEFALFDETVARLGANGIESILCTPTATPPRWLTLKHPDIVKVNAQGQMLRHGSRQHASLAHPVFREYGQRITRAMAEHFRDQPHVVGWQTDNEIHCQISEDHSPAAQLEWQAFLSDKFQGDIDALNRAWGTAFWAQTYRSFEEVPTPITQRPTYCNPAQLLDYARFMAWAAARFQREQIVVLRATQPRWWITHNGLFSRVDYRGAFGQDLDVLGYDVYPMFERKPVQRGATHALWLDAARSWTGNFLVLEHQSGAGGQGDYMLDTPEPLELRRMVYSTLARGADGLLFFRWRTCRYGAEEYWCGILDHDNVPRRRYQEVALVGAELARVGSKLLGTHVQIDVAIAASDIDNAEAHAALPLGLPNPWEIAGEIHGDFYRAGFAVGCVHPEDDLSGVKLYFIPHWVIIDPAWVQRLASWVRASGTLVIGARSGTRDLDNNVTTDLLPGCLRELCGLTVVEYGRQNCPDERKLELEVAGRVVLSRHWYEQLELAPGTQVVASWTSRHLKGTPAIALRELGAGKVLYVGTYLTAEVREALLPEVVKLAGLKPQLAELPGQVEVVQRQGAAGSLWFVINHAASEVVVPNVPNGFELLSQRTTTGSITLGPWGVAVIESR